MTQMSNLAIEIDPLSAIPIYQQIRDRIVLAIGAGSLRRGDQLASVRALAGAFRINPATVMKAYDLLRAEGLITTNSKSGSVVARSRDSGSAERAFLADWSLRLETLLAEARAQGLPVEAQRTLCAQLIDRLETGKITDSRY